MKRNDDLYRLIKSLSKSEKRYFKLFASNHVIGAKNNYLKLFEVIDKQKEYDEEQICTSLKGETFIKYLPQVKSYLYLLILKSLNAFHIGMSVEIQLMQLLQSVTILYNKGLHDQCIEILQKAKKIAYRHEKFFIIFQIYKWETTLLNQNQSPEELRKNIHLLEHEKNSALNKLLNIYDYVNLVGQVFYLRLTKGKIRSKDEIAEAKKIIHNPLFNDEKRALSYEAKIHFNYILASCYEDIGKFEKAYIYRRRNVELSESLDKDLLQENIMHYIYSLNHFSAISLWLGKRQEVHESLIKLKSIIEKYKLIPEDFKVRIFTRIHIFELEMYIKAREFEKGLNVINSIKDKLEEYKDKIDKINESILYHRFALVYFELSEYKKSMIYINKVLSKNRKSIRQDIHIECKILNLIIHYELGNDDILAYHIKSAYNAMRKNTRHPHHKTELIILEFFKNISRVTSEKTKREAFKKLKLQIINILKNPIEKKTINYFDIVKWIERKILASRKRINNK